MSLPHRLPRSEIGGQVPPRAARAEPPSDPFQDQPVVTEPVAPLAHIRRHHRFDSRPELVRNHTHSRHRPIVAGHSLQIRETRPSRSPGAQTIALAPLDDSQITRLVSELLGPDPSVAGLAKRIAERASGNPFFAEEIVRDLADRNVFR